MTDKPILDRIDRRIVHELQHDARIPMRDLAGAIGAAASTCSERIRRLQTRNVITVFGKRQLDVSVTFEMAGAGIGRTVGQLQLVP